jgi:hypothetical protein
VHVEAVVVVEGIVLVVVVEDVVRVVGDVVAVRCRQGEVSLFLLFWGVYSYVRMCVYYCSTHCKAVRVGGGG